jgi:hypothetical protein
MKQPKQLTILNKDGKIQYYVKIGNKERVFTEKKDLERWQRIIKKEHNKAIAKNKRRVLRSTLRDKLKRILNKKK